jgi:L-fuconolactonase
MLNFPIIDTHTHFWDMKRIRYDWLENNRSLGRTHGPTEYSAAVGSIQVEGIVFMEAVCVPEDGVREAAWVAELAQGDRRIRGIVAKANMDRGKSVADELDQLRENPLVRGVRRLIKYEQDAEFPLRPSFIEAVRLLPQYGYSFDLCISYPQTDTMVRFVERCPDVRMVLDHMGTPIVRDRVLHPWKEQMKRLAQFPNVWCKISSIYTEANWKRYAVEDVRPFVEHLIEVFGFERVMWGGDWPVSAEAAPYPEHLEAVDLITRSATGAQRAKLFRENGIAFYGLGI